MKAATVDCHPTAVRHEALASPKESESDPIVSSASTVAIGPDSVVQSNAVIDGYTTIGARCRVFPFASLGLEPQDLKFRGEVSTLEVGDDNTFASS